VQCDDDIAKAVKVFVNFIILQHLYCLLNITLGTVARPSECPMSVGMGEGRYEFKIPLPYFGEDKQPPNAPANIILNEGEAVYRVTKTALPTPL
jgi:hypothetical protein